MRQSVVDDAITSFFIWLLVTTIFLLVPSVNPEATCASPLSASSSSCGLRSMGCNGRDHSIEPGPVVSPPTGPFHPVENVSGISTYALPSVKVASPGIVQLSGYIYKSDACACATCACYKCDCRSPLRGVQVEVWEDVYLLPDKDLAYVHTSDSCNCGPGGIDCACRRGSHCSYDCGWFSVSVEVGSGKNLYVKVRFDGYSGANGVLDMRGVSGAKRLIVTLEGNAYFVAQWSPNYFAPGAYGFEAWLDTLSQGNGRNDDEIAHIYVDCWKTFAYFRDTHSYPQPLVTARFYPSDANGPYCSGYEIRYNAWNNAYLDNERTDSIIHEYSHSLNYGFNDNGMGGKWPSSICSCSPCSCANHGCMSWPNGQPRCGYVCTCNPCTCTACSCDAVTEGWARFVPCMIHRDSTYHWTHLSTHDLAPDSSNRGEKNEWGFGGLLWDIYGKYDMTDLYRSMNRDYNEPGTTQKFYENYVYFSSTTKGPLCPIFAAHGWLGSYWKCCSQCSCSSTSYCNGLYGSCSSYGCGGSSCGCTGTFCSSASSSSFPCGKTKGSCGTYGCANAYCGCSGSFCKNALASSWPCGKVAGSCSSYGCAGSGCVCAGTYCRNVGSSSWPCGKVKGSCGNYGCQAGIYYCTCSGTYCKSAVSGWPCGKVSGPCSSYGCKANDPKGSCRCVGYVCSTYNALPCGGKTACVGNCGVAGCACSGLYYCNANRCTGCGPAVCACGGSGCSTSACPTPNACGGTGSCGSYGCQAGSYCTCSGTYCRSASTSSWLCGKSRGSCASYGCKANDPKGSCACSTQVCTKNWSTLPCGGKTACVGSCGVSGCPCSGLYYCNANRCTGCVTTCACGGLGCSVTVCPTPNACGGKGCKLSCGGVGCGTSQGCNNNCKNAGSSHQCSGKGCRYNNGAGCGGAGCASTACVTQCKLYGSYTCTGPCPVGTRELAYDDGSADFGFIAWAGAVASVKFKVSSPVKVLELKFMIWGELRPVRVHVLDAGFRSMFSRDITPNVVYPNWFRVDVSGGNVWVCGDFYVGWQWPAGGEPWFGVDNTPPHHRMSYLGSLGSPGLPKEGEDYMIRVIIQESAWLAVPTGSTDVGPAIAFFNNRLYAAVKGNGNTRIYLNSMDPTTLVWSGWSLQPGTTPSSPALAASSTYLYMVVRGTNNKIYWRRMSTGGSWSAWIAVPTGSTDAAPAATIFTFNGRLYCAVKGNGNTRIYLNSMDTGTLVWGSWVLQPGATPSSPALTSSSSYVYMAVRGSDNKIYWRRMTTGGSWSGWTAVPTGSTDAAPAISIFENRLWIAVKGLGSNQIYVNSMDASSGLWSGWTRIDGLTPSPYALTASTIKLYLAVRGIDNRIYWRNRTSAGSAPSSAFQSTSIPSLASIANLMQIGSPSSCHRNRLLSVFQIPSNRVSPPLAIAISWALLLHINEKAKST